MATLNVRQSGGSYSTLASALSAAAAGDTISIEGSWTVDDTTICTIADDNLTIEAVGPARHRGYWDETENHYRLVSSAGHALTLNGAYSATIDGLAIEQAGTGVSDEGFRCVPGTADTVTIKNTLIQCSTVTDQQDCVYTGYNTSIGTITFESSILYGASRGGINSENGYTLAGVGGTVNVNSCTIYDCARYLIGTEYGGAVINAFTLNNDGNTFVVNVHNTIGVGCNGNKSGDRDFNTLFNPLSAFNVSYSIDSDGSIATDTDGGTGNLANRTATDSASPGTGDWVVFEDITTAPYDLRLQDNAENDAQDAHSTATAHGLTIPSVDIVGTARPQNTNYDIGAFEISAGTGDTLTATGITSGTPALASPTLAQAHTLAATGAATTAPTLGAPSLGGEAELTADGLATQAPTLASPTLAQEHAITATGITAAAPALDTPTAGQEHALSATEIATAAPALGTPALAQEQALSATGITAGQPTSSAPAIAQTHSLAADPAETGQPVLGTPSMAGEVTLSPAALATPAPSIGSPTIGQEHTLTATDTTAGAPALQAASIGQSHVLGANGSAAGIPVLGAPSLAATSGIVATPLVTGAPVLGSPSIAQAHGLTAVQTITAAPAPGTPSLGQIHALLAAALVAGAPVLGTPSTILATGTLSVAFTVKQPGVAITGLRPGITALAKQPGVTITVKE